MQSFLFMELAVTLNTQLQSTLNLQQVHLTGHFVGKPKVQCIE